MRARLVHIARIPVLVVLFAAVGPPYLASEEATRRIDLGAYWGPWTQMGVLAVVFVAVSLFDRQRWHSRVVLMAEAVVAALLTLPGFQWFAWFGVPGLDGFLGWQTFNEFSRALAFAWLVIAITTLARQVRSPRTRSAPTH